MITLYNVPVSSYGCKIRILLGHKSIAHETIAPPDGYGSDAYCAIAPAGTVPAIDHGGFILSDSEAIAEYLNELYPDPPMWPDAIAERARAREISRFHDTRIEPLLRGFFGQVAPASRDQTFIAENAALLQRRFTQLAEIVTPNPLLCGSQLTIADCSFVASFAILNILREAIGFDCDLPPSLSAFESALATHPSIGIARAEYIDTLTSWAKTKINS